MARPPSGWQEARGRLGEFALGQAGVGVPGKELDRHVRAPKCCWLDCRRGQAAGQSRWRYLLGSYKHTPNLGEGASLHGVGSCWHVVDTSWGSGVTEEGGGLTWDCFLSFLLKGLVFVSVFPTPEVPFLSGCGVFLPVCPSRP